MSESIGVILSGDNSSFRSMMDSSTALVSKFSSVMNTLGVGIGAAAVAGFFKNIVEKGGALQDLSDRLNVSTDALQSFEYFVKQAGGTSDQAVMVWDRARKSLDSLAAGAPAVVKQFAAIGLSAESFKGLNLEESVEKITRGFAENKDAAGSFEAFIDILGTKGAPKLQVALEALAEKGFGGIIKAAKDAGQVIDEDAIKRFDEFGDRLDRHKGQATIVGASILDFVMKAVDGWGIMFAAGVNAMDGIETSVEGIAVQSKKADKAVRDILPALQQLTSEGKKQIEQELEQARAGDEKLSREKRLLMLKSDLLDIDDQLKKSSLTQYEIDGLNVMREETVKLIKTEQKALNADALKHAQRMEGMTAKEIEDKRALLTTAEQIAELKQDEAGWAAVLADQGIEASVRQNAEYELAKTRAAMRPLEVMAEQERLAVLQAQEGVMEQQLQTAKAITVEVSRTGKSYDQQSDDSLEGVRNRLRQQIDQLKRDSFGKSWGVGGTGTTPEIYILQSELANLEKEATERKEVRDYASRFGEQKARQQFGDTLTDKALRDWSDDAKASRTALEDLQQRIATLIPKK